ncbi:MAG: tryptophan--tRNA ligase, partial [Candidatus Aminicenantes bacterium]
MTKRKRILSGIQPSGTIHIGNYFGAIENWVRLTKDYDCFFTIVDYHAITVQYDPALMQKRIREAALDNIAAGLDPSRCTIFVQSHVPEHTELCWLLNCVTPMGELSRMTQFKEKSERERENVTAGLLNYPILQAADILIYKADAVPVGDDQAQHLEFTREVARRFNGRFGEFFPEPATLIGRGARVMGIDGGSKMSKSLDNHIGVVEDPEAIWEKLRPAKTDEARKRRSDPGSPDRCNIFSYHKL